MWGQVRSLWTFFSRWLTEPSRREQLRLPSESAAFHLNAGSDEPVDGGRIESRPAFSVVDSASLARVFDSSHPVRTRAELFGRDAELSRLLDAAIDTRQHMVIHGLRGSGKTSVARVFGDYADQQGIIVIYLTCEDNASFADLMLPYLQALPASALSPSHASSFRSQLESLPAQFGPRAFANLVGEAVIVPTVFILDEFDRLQGDEVKAHVSTAMKMLSDTLSEVLLMLVGIAETVDDMIAAHPSLRRHLRAVPLARIAPVSVEALVDRSADAAGLPFSGAAREMIARAACGSPYHVRLFCLHAALDTLRQRDRLVEPMHVLAGFRTAFLSWASMNETDARAFVRVAKAPEAHQAAVDIALEFGMSGTIAEQPDAGFISVVKLLGPALLPDGKRRGRVLFRDASAAQFLLALVILTEDGNGGDVLARIASESPHVFLD